MNKFLYYFPRVLSILFVLFLALMSLDVFSSELNFWQTAGALFMHNIPALILLAVLIISWKREFVGGVFFILAGMFYLAMLLRNIITTGFEWYYLAWGIQISGIAFLIGILFLIGWKREK
ncbi:MAG: hypothetical protein UT31_C0002G0002 [Parcubacteria group bacterium GW2011_GWF2_39_13b]|nr:MAG: hypothetical protein UT31_C0002G0002 [Parcubacteria group bacterium GW2011_GWF2_39_13b]